MRNIFLEKSYTECDVETSVIHFSKKSLLNISLDQQSKVLYSVCMICQVEGYRIMLKLKYTPLAFTSYKAFLKNKERSATSLLA